jgi:WD40 repeat protein
MNRNLLLATALALAPLLRAEEPAPLTLKNSVALPGVEGRFDHAAVDPATHRLFFAALGNNTLEVVDLSAGKRLHSITGLKKPTGVLFLSDMNLLVVASGDDGTCRFYDGTSYAERGRVTGVDDADNLRFDAKGQRVYLGFGEGALGVIDPVAMKLTASIALPKHPESFQLEENGTRIFVNIPDAKQIAVVDRATSKVVATWPVEEAHANFPMALAEKQHRVFVGCRQPARLLAFDTESGKRVADATMSGDVDDLFFDASTSDLFASCGEGFIDVFRFTPPANLARTQRLASAAGARTAFFSAKLGMFCLAVPHRGTQGAEIRIYKLPVAQ